MKELEDNTWFPTPLRNFQTDFIGFVVTAFNIYAPFIDRLKTVSFSPQRMYDLCSGSGEPAISIFHKSNRFTQLTLSDKYPRVLHDADAKTVYLSESVDVMQMDFSPRTCYTMFNAFHHFSDENKVQLIRKIQESNATVFIVEVLEPSLWCFLKVLFMTTIGTICLTPFIQPFSVKRLLFTYLLPINLVTILFDGVVSVFKSRSLKQYQELFSPFGNSIEVIRIKNHLLPLLVIHHPHKKSQEPRVKIQDEFKSQ